MSRIVILAKKAFKCKTFLQFFYYSSVMRWLNEEVCCKLACINAFSFKPAYGEPTRLLVFMNMETRRCHDWTVTSLLLIICKHDCIFNGISKT